jgi:glycerol-3-phosphate dehydrogenase subunit B
MVYPKEIKEQVFNLPVAYPEKPYNEDFFDLKGHSLFSAGIKVNNKLQSVNPDNNNIIFHNLFVAGATLSGYDPFLEKSGNGVAITTGYKAALMTIEGENHE